MSYPTLKVCDARGLALCTFEIESTLQLDKLNVLLERALRQEVIRIRITR